MALLKTNTFIFFLLLPFFSFAQDYGKLVAAAENYYKLKEFEKSALAYEQAFAVRNKKIAGDLYNAACSRALNGDNALALGHLKNAIDNGWTSLDWMQKDTDLESLHGEKEWQKLVKKLTKTRKKLEKNWNRPLMEQLAIIKEKDQRHRKDLQSVSAQYGWGSPEMDALWEQQNILDSVNQLDIIKIIDQYGYPGRSLVGEQAGAAFLVIQHADISMQKKYLPILKKAAEKDELRWSSLALLIDRVNMREGKPQIYGSQLVRDEETGGWKFYNIEDEKNVNKRRIEVGLGKLEDYARRFDVEYTLPKD